MELRLAEERKLSTRDLSDIKSAIKDDKFWWVSEGRKDLIYVLALRATSAWTMRKALSGSHSPRTSELS